jgi:uncharacterized protein
MQNYAVRFQPASDLKQEIKKFAKEKRIQAGAILTCVGSLQQACLRFVHQPQGALMQGYVEIISLMGTIALNQEVHLHMTLPIKKAKYWAVIY